MNGAREEILARVRAATDAVASLPPVPRDYRRTDEHPHEQLVTLFCERIDDYKAEVDRVTAGSLPDAITPAASRHGVQSLVVPPQVPNAWRPLPLELIADSRLRPSTLDQIVARSRAVRWRSPRRARSCSPPDRTRAVAY